VLEAQQAQERSVPDYIEFDSKEFTAKFVRTPKLTDVPYR